MNRTKKPKPKSGNLLTGQKPILPQRKKTALLRKIGKGLALSAGVLAVGYGAFLGYRHKEQITGFLQNKTSIVWDIRFNQRSPGSLTPELRQTLAKELQQAIPTDDAALFREAARALQKKHGAKEVHLLRTGVQEISVTISFREPLMRVEADSERLLSTDGEVYGPDSRTREDLPLLAGVLDTKTASRFNDNGTVELTKEQKEIVSEVTALLKELANHKIEVVEIQYAAYRGFTPRLKMHDLEVTLGRQPFDKKISRLNEILLKLDQKGLAASKIELDYEGKAFIKERKF